MKVLIIAKMKDTWSMLTPEVRKQLFDEQAKFLKKCAIEGKLKEIYFLADCNGGASIWEIDSAEEGARLFLELPTYVYQDFQLHILSEFPF